MARDTLTDLNVAAIAAEEALQQELAEFAALTPDEKAARTEAASRAIRVELEKRNAAAAIADKQKVMKLGVPPPENKSGIKLGKGIIKPERTKPAKKVKRAAPKKVMPKVKKSKKRGR